MPLLVIICAAGRKQEVYGAIAEWTGGTYYKGFPPNRPENWDDRMSHLTIVTCAEGDELPPWMHTLSMFWLHSEKWHESICV